ncbi:MAG: phosphoribosylanthranilate isomerase, partial [Ignavibacteriaceae bacterium]|nr:phosphoribosylanthranilate isomerase [Ignavibacteriaceae bacterium]
MQKIDFNHFIQVAGVMDQQEADMLTACGVNFLGFPLRLPVNKEDLTENEAKEIIQKLSHPNYGIVISYSSTADEAIEL